MLSHPPFDTWIARPSRSRVERATLDPRPHPRGAYRLRRNHRHPLEPIADCGPRAPSPCHHAEIHIPAVLPDPDALRPVARRKFALRPAAGRPSPSSAPSAESELLTAPRSHYFNPNRPSAPYPGCSPTPTRRKSVHSGVMSICSLVKRPLLRFAGYVRMAAPRTAHTAAPSTPRVIAKPFPSHPTTTITTQPVIHPSPWRLVPKRAAARSPARPVTSERPRTLRRAHRQVALAGGIRRPACSLRPVPCRRRNGALHNLSRPFATTPLRHFPGRKAVHGCRRLHLHHRHRIHACRAQGRALRLAAFRNAQRPRARQ